MVMIMFSVAIKAQGPPPPCGLSPAYACDENNDGIEIFDLVILYPFKFCMAPTLNPADYHPTTYHVSEEDAKNDVNAIANPANYISPVVFQIIYFRAEKIVPDGSNDILLGYDYLYVLPPPTANTPTPLTACNSSNSGFAIFDFTNKKLEILSGQINYGVNFFETLNDAQNLTNAIPLVGYTNTIAYQQTIYGSVYVYGDSNCIDIVEFDLIVQGQCEDLAVYLTNTSAPPRPGFDYSNYLYIENVGSKFIASGTVEFTLDANLQFNGVPSSGAEYSITVVSNGFTLDFVNLEIGETLPVFIPLFCPVSVDLGTQIINSATYTTNSEDIYSLNDTSILFETVVGSFDPNDIIESHGSTIFFNDFTNDDFLYYTIRFQNVGTAEAFDIKIENELDVKLDEPTFQLLNSSHINGLNRIGNQLTWTFTDINLPSENIDEPNSHGFVYYKIKPKTGYTVGDIIPNAADIFFDFNPAVVTNTFETEFIATLSVENNMISEFFVFPNPANDMVNLKFNNIDNKPTINIYDILGKLVLNYKGELQNNILQLDVSSLTKGVYFLEFINDTGKVAKKLIIE